jgi:hypothetical protein
MAPKRQTITIDTEENDDWMKALPGYQDEVAITEAALGGKASGTGPVLKFNSGAQVKKE